MLRIGEVAKQSGVSVDAVRFYERRGVLPEAERLPSGYRAFDESAIQRIRLTKQLQGLGLTLDEIVDALAAFDRGDADVTDHAWRLERVLDRIDAEITELARLRDTVATTLACCTEDPAREKDHLLHRWT